VVRKSVAPIYKVKISHCADKNIWQEYFRLAQAEELFTAQPL